MSRIRRVLIVIVTGLTVVACTSNVSPSASPTASAESSPTSDALVAARDDLDRLLHMLDAVHPNAWHGITRDAFVAELDQLKDGLGELTPDETLVAVMRLVGLISANGQDGHMFAVPADRSFGTAMPLRVYEFSDGLFITAAAPPHEDLAGKRITAVNGLPIQDVLAALDPLVPRDGPATVPGFRPIFFLRLDVLRGLGLVGNGPIVLTVADGAGEADVSLDPMSLADYAAWAGPGGMVALPVRDIRWLSRPSEILYVEYLADSRSLYVRYRQIQPFGPTLATEVQDRADDPDVDRVIIDLRENGGGDNHTYGALLSAVQSQAVDRPGRLFVLTDRLTFSAAANFATRMEQTTGAIFAGEPMGGGLNFWDDVTQVRLPNLAVPMTVGVSVRYWEMSTPDDPRLTIDPGMPIPYRSVDYFADRDPVLDAVLAPP